MFNYSTNKLAGLKKWAIIICLDALLLIAILFLLIKIYPKFHTNINIDGVYIDQPRDLADFNLLDQHGKPFTKQQLKGHWTLLYYGFTHCPMICPTTLDALNKMYSLLEKQIPKHLLPQIVFITIDPENDTVARLNQFINSYNTHFIAATSNTNKTTTATDFNGSKNHNTDILVVNPQVQIQAYFLYPHRPVNMARDYQRIIGQVTKS